MTKKPKLYTFQSYWKHPRLVWIGTGILIAAILLGWQGKQIERERELRFKAETELLTAKKSLTKVTVSEKRKDGSTLVTQTVKEDTDITKERNTQTVEQREVTYSPKAFAIGLGLDMYLDPVAQFKYRPWMGNFSLGVSMRKDPPYLKNVMLIYTMEF